jgi:hypothetical protein
MKKNKSSSIFKTICLFICMVIVSLATQAQTPAANISGPLKATANGANIAITSQIIFGYQNPGLTYTLDNNTSGASIVSKAAYIYDPATEEGTQKVEINPGSSAGSFVITLEVKTIAGTGKCSKSVVVSNSSTGNGPNK